MYIIRFKKTLHRHPGKTDYFLVIRKRRVIKKALGCLPGGWRHMATLRCSSEKMNSVMTLIHEVLP